MGSKTNLDPIYFHFKDKKMSEWVNEWKMTEFYLRVN